MGNKTLAPLAVSAFCENMAMMLAAGIQVDDALLLLGEDSADGPFHEAAAAVLARVQSGETFAAAVAGCGCFPSYAAGMVAAGEEAGRTEDVLKSLAAYYETQEKLAARLRSAVVYPMLLLLLMAVVLGVLVARVLPVFADVYTGLAGDVAASSYAYITAANVIGRIALWVVVVLAAVLLAGTVLARTRAGGAVIRRVLEKLPFTARAAGRLAEAQFTTALATYVASGMDTDTAMEQAAGMVHSNELRKKLTICQSQMAEGRSLAQVVYDNRVFEPLYARMLLSGARSGNLENVLARLAATFTDDANARMDRIIDSIEPALAAFLTVSVGLTLLSVMLPLIGILASVG